VLSRILYGARISLTIGLLGIAISFTLGLVIGGLARYYGGWVDMTVRRSSRSSARSGAAVVDGAVRRGAGDVESHPDLLRHNGDPGKCSDWIGTCARRAPNFCLRCAKRIIRRPRG
jgi:hypothetical protein